MTEDVRESMKLTGNGGTEESTEESTNREDRDDQRLGGRGDGVATGVGGGRLTELSEPGIHLLDTADHTGIVTEEDTTKRAERDHENTNKFALRETC